MTASDIDFLQSHTPNQKSTWLGYRQTFCPFPNAEIKSLGLLNDVDYIHCNL